MTDSTTLMTPARKLALWSIAMQAVTLFMKVQNDQPTGILQTDADWNNQLVIFLPGSFGDQSGMALHPMGMFVLPWLAFMFLTNKYDGWWGKHGYKVAVVAMFLTSGGGGCIGGYMNVGAFWLMVYAAYRRHKELKVATANGSTVTVSEVTSTGEAPEAVVPVVRSNEANGAVAAPKRVRKSPTKQAEAAQTAIKKNSLKEASDIVGPKKTRKSSRKEAATEESVAIGESVAPAEKEIEVAAKPARKRKSAPAVIDDHSES